MTLFATALLVGAALVALGVAALLLRRSLIGAVVGFELMMGGALVLAIVLLTRTGADASAALVAGGVCIAVGVAAAVLVTAAHLAAARAARHERDLEPW